MSKNTTHTTQQGGSILAGSGQNSKRLRDLSIFAGRLTMEGRLDKVGTFGSRSETHADGLRANDPWQIALKQYKQTL